MRVFRSRTFTLLPGKASAAEPLYQKAIAAFRRLPGQDIRAGVALNNLALLYSRAARFEEAESSFLLALQLKEQSIGPEMPDTGITIDNLAQMYSKQGRYDEAFPLHMRAVEIFARGADNRPSLAIAKHNSGLAQNGLGQLDPAARSLREAIAIKTELYGGSSPAVAPSLNALAVVRRKQDRLKEAEALYRRAVAAAEHNNGSD